MCAEILVVIVKVVTKIKTVVEVVVAGVVIVMIHRKRLEHYSALITLLVCNVANFLPHL